MAKQCTFCYTQMEDHETKCPNCGTMCTPAGNNLANQPDMPMKWFKFVIYFQLFAAAVLNGLSAISYFTGSIYETQGVSSSQVYYYFPGMQSIDMIYAVAVLAMAVFALVVRFALSGYKANGPKLYLAYLGCNVAIPVLYAILAASAIGGMDFSSVIGSAIGSIILLLCNITYFKKREHLFTN